MGTSPQVGALTPRHRAQLVEGSAIDVDVILERGYHSSPDGKELRIPVYPPGLTTPALIVVRPDTPKDPKRKYEWPKGAKKRLDVHPRMHGVLEHRDVPLWVVEGVKKGDSLVSRGCCAVALDGVWCFGATPTPDLPILRDWEQIVLAGRTVYIGYDSDTWRKPHVLLALKRLTTFLQDRGAQVEWIVLEDTADGKKVGVDDFLVAGGTVEELLARCTAPFEVAVELDPGDFVAYLPDHTFVDLRTGLVWGNEAVNEVLPSRREGETIIKPSRYLSRQSPVHARTWAPGEDQIIEGRVFVEHGWVQVPRCTLNTYHPPAPVPEGARAERAEEVWAGHILRLYGEAGRWLIAWLAHKVQAPGKKINHGIVLGGRPGVGKDFIIESVREAIGPANIRSVTPRQLLERFNDYLECTLLLVSELRDLGDRDRFALYDHMKTLLAEPPSTLRIDKKYVPPYWIPNVVGVVYTTNYKEEGLFLAEDDRRHYVLWTDVGAEDLGGDAYFERCWSWLLGGGYGDVAAYLQEFNWRAVGFNPDAPPPKTRAFWDVVRHFTSPESAELADVLDAMGRPEIVTVPMVVDFCCRARSQNGGGGGGGKITVPPGIVEWLTDRRNARHVGYRFRDCGYTKVVNPDAQDGYFVVNGRRRVVYCRGDVPERERVARAEKCLRAGGIGDLKVV